MRAPDRPPPGADTASASIASTASAVAQSPFLPDRLAGPGARVGIAGVNTHPIARGVTTLLPSSPGLPAPRMAAALGAITLSTTSSESACGIAGNLSPQWQRRLVDEAHEPHEFAAVVSLDRRRERQDPTSRMLGDRAAQAAWSRAIFFLDFSYLVAPVRGGSTDAAPVLRWREGREVLFGPATRRLPLYLDSGGFRRMVGTAPRWTQAFDVYPAAIERTQPDGYAAWDLPQDRRASLEALDALLRLFPQHAAERRLWPVFSVRWLEPMATAEFAWGPLPDAWKRLPGLEALIPLNATQLSHSRAQRERWVREAIGCALAIARDPDFLRLIEVAGGQVMLGGLVRSPTVARMARHVVPAVLAHLFPGLRLWLLGQASHMVVNGLGYLGMIDRVSTDGSWFIHDACCERIAYLQDGLVTTLALGRSKTGAGSHVAESFFTRYEKMASLLRSILGAYAQLWPFPVMPLPIDPRDGDQLAELREHYRAAERELVQLGLWEEV